MVRSLVSQLKKFFANQLAQYAKRQEEQRLAFRHAFGPQTPHNPAHLQWSIVSGELTFNGEEHEEPILWRKSDIENTLLALKEKIILSKMNIRITAVYIERDVAIALWREGTINLATLLGSDTHFDGITFDLELLGETLPVAVRWQTRTGEFEFALEGLENVYTVRNADDFIATLFSMGALT